MPVIIYTRFSPQRQANLKESCEAQEDACRKWATSKGETVKEVFADKEMSGADADRPGLWEAVKAVKAGDTLLVYKLDRLARDYVLAEYIRGKVASQKGQIRAVDGDIDDDSDIAVLIRQVLASFAEFERKMIGKRTASVMRYKMMQGQRMSRWAPYGWRLTKAGKQEQDPGEQAILAVIRELHANDNDDKQIKDELARGGHKYKGGRAFTLRHVKRITARF
jgi:DNA invertase Pin-like site-specific DNA recombinase